MIPLIVMICVVAVIAFLLSIKITLRIKYTDSLNVYLKIFFVKIKLYPSKKKKKRYPHSMSKRKAQKIKSSLKKKPKKDKKKKKSETTEESDETADKNDTLSIISIILSFVRSFVNLFTRAIRLKASRLKVTVATEEAAKTALTYTAITQSVNILFPLLDRLKAVKKLPRGKELSVDIDYLSDTSTFDIDIELYVRVGRALKAVCGAAINAFKKAVKDRFRKLERQK